MSASPPKKRKTENESSSSDESTTEKSPAPQYGSKEYWEERYKKTNGTQSSGESVGDDGPVPFHSWYFTYEELRPLLLPLILGGRDEATRVIMDDDAEDEEDTSNDFDSTPTISGKKKSDKQLVSENNRQNADRHSTERAAARDESTACHKSDVSVESSTTNVDDLDSDNEEDVVAEREGLAKDGPISILEVGCGDVPLGRKLAMELVALEANTGAKAGNIVARILCCDYSETVVKMLQSSPVVGSRDKHVDIVEAGNDKKHGANPELKVEYVVADARKLPYADGEINLVLEKGTLDAMLSDTKTGVANCVSIVTECARVLAVEGYFVIISHLNAHTQNGLGWLDEVVVPGLRAGGGSATWEIEIHANDGLGDEVNTIDDAPIQDNNEKLSPMGSPGPAVYIIRKEAPGTLRETSVENDYDPLAIPLKFFGY